MRNKVRGGYPLALPELSAWRASAALGWGAALGVLFRCAGKGKGSSLDLGVWWGRAGLEQATGGGQLASEWPGGAG